MKKTTLSITLPLRRALTLLAAGLSLMAITSCKEKEEAPESYFEIEGTRYVISSSALSFNGNGFDPVNISYRYTLYLVSGDASITGWEGNDANISGTGKIMIINLNTPDATKPAAGPYPRWTAGIVGNNLGGAGYYDITSGTTDGTIELGEGTTELSYEGDTMTITYDGQDEYGRDVTIVFTGNPSIVDVSDNT